MNNRPTAYAAVVEGTLARPTIVEMFRITTAEKLLVEQIHDIARAFANRVTGLAAGRVVVRRADQPKRASNMEGPKVRLLVEGALVAVARERVPQTSLLSGRDLAAAAGGGRTKASLDADAATLTADQDYVAAVAAAIALLDH